MKSRDFGAGIWALERDVSLMKEIGMLSVDDKTGIILDIPFGTLEPPKPIRTYPDPDLPYKYVYGFLQTGKYVCLEDVGSNGASSHSPGGTAQKYYCGRAYLARKEFDVTKPIKKIQLGLNHLREWFGDMPYYQTQKYVEEGRKLVNMTYSVDTDCTQPLSLRLSGMSLSLIHTWTAHPPIPSGFSFDHDCKLEIVFDKEVDLQTAEKTVQSVASFFSFCIDEYVEVNSIDYLYSGQDFWVELIPRYISARQSDKVKSRDDMLLPYSYFRENEDLLRLLLKKWLGFDDHFAKTVRIITSAKADWSMPIDLEFLSKAQALESLSRLGREENEISRGELRARRGSVRELCGDELGKWAYNKLSGAGKKSANDLLNEFLNEIGPYVEYLIPDRARFINEHRASRDYYTHRSTKPKKGLLAVEALYKHSLGVELLFQAGLLVQLGISQFEVLEIMKGLEGVNRKPAIVKQAYSLP